MPIQAAAVRRVWRTVGFGLIALVIWLSLTPQPIEIPVENGDKLGHVAAYATLMFWFAQLDTRHRMRLAYAIGFVMLGVALEFAQRLTDYRTFEVADMGAVGSVTSCENGPDRAFPPRGGRRPSLAFAGLPRASFPAREPRERPLHSWYNFEFPRIYSVGAQEWR